MLQSDVKTKDMIVNYSKRRTEHAPILIIAVMKQVESFKFLGVHITNKLSWSKHNKTNEKRAPHSLFPLKRLNIFGMGPQILKVLQLQHQEHPDWLHHCLVWQLLGLRPQGNTEGSAYGQVHHWGQASCHPGHQQTA